MQRSAWLVLVLTACGGGSSNPGGGHDSGIDGSGTTDGAIPPDADTNVCMPACATEPNANDACDVFLTCESTCDTGFARCGDACTAESPTQCGPGCATCPAPSANGNATCSGGVCGVACSAGYSICDAGDASSGCCAYTSELVAPVELGGAATSIAVDKLGKLHVAYEGAWDYRLRYATNASGAWTYEDVRDGWYVAGTAAQQIAIGPKGPLVMYTYPYTDGVILAERVAGGWTSSPVVADAPAGFGFTTDRAGRGHACFTGSTTVPGVRYGLRSGDRWTITQLNTDAEATGACAIAVDTAGLPHIVYYKATAQDVAYASADASGNFTFGTVDTAGDVGASLAIVIATDGTPHVAAYRTDTQALRHGELHGSTWTVETVGTGHFGSTPSIAMSSAGPVITSFDSDMYRVVVSTKVNTTWTSTPFANVASGSGPIAADPSGGLHVATADYDVVAHAQSGSTWTDDPIDTFDYVADNLSLLHTSGGDAILTYTKNHANADTVEVARHANGTWTFAELTGLAPSAAIDASNFVHVAYSLPDASLGYAVETAAGFGAPEMLAPAEAYSVGLALDSTGAAHAVYTTSTGLQHAVRGATAWTVTKIASGSYTNIQNPIIRIANNVVHVLWYDPVALTTVYASSADNFATPITLDTATTTAHDLFVTAAGVPHACFGKTNGTSGFPVLRYATRATATWSTPITVAPPGTQSDEDVCAIVVDAGGVVSIGRDLLYGAGLGETEITTLGTTNTTTLVHDDFYSYAMALGIGPGGLEIATRGQNYNGNGLAKDRLRWAHK